MFQEWRSSFSLALIFALRTLGLFLILPIFSLEAPNYIDGDNLSLVGLALGVYGLTQAIFQWPLGWISDKFGRKKIIILGLLIFAAGSFISYLSNSIYGLIIGRSLQGAGAISASTMALLSDLTSNEFRTKAMMLVGLTIGSMFALSLLIAPILNNIFGLSGIFLITLILSLICIFAVIFVVPKEPKADKKNKKSENKLNVFQILIHDNLWRLNFGVFILHALQISIWLIIPKILIESDLSKENHWQVYLPSLLLSIIFMRLIIILEKSQKINLIFIISIVLLLIVQIILYFSISWNLNLSINNLIFILLLFFIGFNTLEAIQPSLISKISLEDSKGSTLGVYNTLQSLGLFFGGFLGNLIIKINESLIFLITAIICLIWLYIYK